MSNGLTLESIDDKIAKQQEHCHRGFLSRSDYYKFNFRALVWIIVFFVGFLGGFAALISGMATVKNEIKHISDKVDMIIHLDKKNKEMERE